MPKSLVTVQYNMNAWQLGMSFESHAFLHSKMQLSESKFVFIAGLNDFVLGSKPYKYHLRGISRNFRLLRKLNHELESNQFVDYTNPAQHTAARIRRKFADIQFDSILFSSAEEFGVDINQAKFAIKLALVDKYKAWNISEIENVHQSKEFLIAYLATYLTAKEIFSKGEYRYLNIFNSRFLNERATKDAAVTLGIEVFEFEQINARSDSFGLFRGSVHDYDARAEQARTQYREAHASNIEMTNYREEWIKKRISGELQNYTKRQTKSKLPNIPSDQKILSCFLSSFDELVLAGYVEKDSDLNQSNALKKLSEEIAKNIEWTLVIRCHPNMLTRPKSEQNYWKEMLKDIKCIVVMPEEDIDTYALIQESDLILTFGSTVAVEALALGVPSIVAGKSLYHGHGMVPTVTSIEEILTCLASPPTIGLEQLSELEAYSYHQLYGGLRFSYLKVRDDDLYTFNPPLLWRNSVAFAPERLLSILTTLYSKIHDLKKLNRFSIS